MSTFTTRERDLMRVLWLSGASTEGEVCHALAESGIELPYNTVLTILRILQQRGHVGHELEGRAHRFRALVARDAASRPPSADCSKGYSITQRKRC